MKFDPPLLPARLVRRYKRFLADIKLPSGEVITVHCPNTGSMKHCIVEGSPCWYSTSNNPNRKYPHTWEIGTAASGDLVGINTGRANALVGEAIANGVIGELTAYARVQAEVSYGAENSRIDFLLSAPQRPDCYLEVKSVTLGLAGGQGLFPDAVSKRGSKHLRELMTMVDQGKRGVLLFCVQHSGVDRVSPADEIDPVYGETLRAARRQGVEVLAYGVALSNAEIRIVRELPVNC